MGDPEMTLREEDVRRIGDYVKPWLRDLVDRVVPARAHGVDTQLLERMVRVEEELKAQRELMTERFTAMDKRFEDQQAYSDKRFTAMEKRFEDLQAYSDRRFRALQWSLGIGFSVVTALVTVFGLLG